MSSTDARLPSLDTCVVESSFSVLSLPESVRVLFERSKLCTRPWSASLWPLAEAPLDAIPLLDPLPVLGLAPLLLLLVPGVEELLDPVPLEAVDSRELPVDAPLCPIVDEV